MVIHMTIKQLEQELEIPRATIRFYEKEKLIAPKRSDNSYREYSEEDVAVLKKVIILRKIGLSVADIKMVLDGDCTLQSLLDKNISNLQNQMKELEGAINVSKLMKDRNEDISSLDENQYWTEMEELEQAGSRFKEILNDVMEYEKDVIQKEFQLVNSEGDLLFGPRGWKENLIRIVGTCACCGLVWFLLEGQNRSFGDFLEGFFWPFVCILFSSVFGLPVHYIGKKNPKLAKKIKKVGTGIAVAFTIGLLILAFVLRK